MAGQSNLSGFFKSQIMKSTRLSDAALKDNPHGLNVKAMYNNHDMQIMIVTIEAGQSMKPHTTPCDALFYILEGKATIHIGNETEEHDEGTFIESPADIEHYISNASAEQTKVMVIKTGKK